METQVREQARGGQPDTAQGVRRIAIDDRGVDTDSCDYWLLNSTPEEVIVRLGNTKANPQGPIKINRRIALSYYSAKRLLGALYQTVQNYEKALGALNIEPTTPPGGPAQP